MKPLFVPSPESRASAQLTSFIDHCAAAEQTSFENPSAFHAYSVRELRRFWAHFVDWSGLLTEGSRTPVCVGDEVETAKFFPELRLGYVENLLRSDGPEDDARPAISACNERGETVRLTRGELTSRVLAVAASLRELGVRAGDHVVAIAASTETTIIACLGAAALGAVWSSVSPDLAAPAIVARFESLAPTVLFHHASYFEGGREIDVAAKLQTVATSLPSLRLLVSLRGAALARATSKSQTTHPTHTTLAQLQVDGAPHAGSLDRLERFPFDHPLFVLFSSGTTGKPKCLVHGAGGTLVEHHKEHRLHGDLGTRDKLYFHTTTSWMMWNWLLSALAAKSEIVVYEGLVTHPNAGALFELVARERVTVFGTSPAYLQHCRDAGLQPAKTSDLSALRAVLSTGAVLREALFEWVVGSVKQVPVQSISGGTDILGCFLLGHPLLPVFAGDLQAASLGLDLQALGVDGKPARSGELVCARPFPSRPIGIHGDVDGERFHQTYFAANPGYWTHGDVLEWTERGSARIHGRSDGILNVRGIRIGPAEIYQALDAIDALAETMAIEQRAPREAGGSRLVLLVVLQPGRALDKELQMEIRRTLLERCSQSHVPSVIAAVDELPQTHNGKRAEKSARDTVNGDLVSNLEALRNPACLEAIRNHPALRVRDENTAGDTETQPSGLTLATASRAELEAHVQTIWRQLLSLPVALDDNFHDLGGHSLVGITILVRVENAFGRRLPMGTFLGRGATVRGMVDELLTPERENATPSIVELQRGGARLPVYWLPGGGGVSTMAFREVSLLLGADQPVYGFEAPMSFDDRPRDLRDTAAEYVRQLRAFRKGPYSLLGFSFGSFMAYEVGCQLRDAGEEVALLAVFDTPAPTRLSRTQKLRVLAQRVGFQLRKLRDDPVEGLSLVVQKLRDGVRRLRPAKAMSEAPKAPIDPAQALFDQVNDRNKAAVHAYAAEPLRPYDGRVTAFLALEGSQSSVDPELDTRLAWGAQASGGIDVFRVSGTHLGMLTQPHVQHLARALRDCLDELRPAEKPIENEASAPTKTPSARRRAAAPLVRATRRSARRGQHG